MTGNSKKFSGVLAASLLGAVFSSEAQAAQKSKPNLDDLQCTVTRISYEGTSPRMLSDVFVVSSASECVGHGVQAAQDADMATTTLATSKGVVLLDGVSTSVQDKDAKQPGTINTITPAGMTRAPGS